MHLYLKVVWIVLSGVWGGSNPVCLILSLKGHSTHCPKIIIKKIHLGIGQQFIRLISVLADMSQPSEKNL